MAFGPFYGGVRYTYADGIDDPLAIWKKDFGGLIPHRSWRGTYLAGTGIDGTADVAWPARSQDVFHAPDVRLTTVQPSDWIGSIVEGKTDPSGLEYMRNRYYDPRTGSFTQEDPIGLAGGMNLYGFAGGDPVNFSDPFGLWPCPELCAGAGTLAVAGPGALAAMGASEELVPVVGQVVGTATLAAAAVWGISSGISAMRNGELGDKARSLLKPAYEHVGKMGGLGPDDEDPNGKNRDWAGDARKAINNARKVVEKMKGKSQEALTKEINQLSEQLSQLAKRVF